MAPSRAMLGHRSACRILFLVMSCFLLLMPAVDGSMLRSSNDKKKGKLVVDVYYVVKLLDKFKNYAVKHQALSDVRHGQEMERLQEAMENSDESEDKTLLEATATENEESKLESQNAFNEMLNFVNTLKNAMGAKGSAPSCEDLTCGEHAVCVDTVMEGAGCKCEDGYEGDGFLCKPPISFTAHPLIPFESKPGAAAPQVGEIHITVFQISRVAVVFRDVSKGEKGYFMLGRAGVAKMAWNYPKLFSNQTKAYGPVIAGLPNGRVAIAWRDQNVGGMGYIMGGQINPKTSLCTLGETIAFARNQAHGYAAIVLPNSRVALMYSERQLDSSGKTKAMHGSALLTQIEKDGVPKELGKYHFAEGPITRLMATRLSSDSFVVAYRAEAEGEKKEEANAIWAQMKGSELMFDPHPISLAPDETEIWGRDVSLVAKDYFAYSFHAGGEQVTKQAIVRVDPGTHKMTIVDGPSPIDEAPTPYVQSVSLPFAPRAPHTFTYYQKPGSGIARAKVCPITPQGKMRDCTDLNFVGYELSTVAAEPLGEGRLLFVFADTTGTPYYQFVGLFDDA